MSDFLSHARAYGLIIKDLRMDGRWHRVPTEDKPRKRNGAYLFDGSRGVVKNWATMQDFASWPEKGDKNFWPLKIEEIAARRKQSEAEEALKHARAARRALETIGECEASQHPYLARKGFPEALGLVHEGDLIVPVVDCKTREVISLQRINVDKKFLPGGRTKGGVFVIGRGPEKWLVEGYATGLSVKAGLDAMSRRGEVWVCFSAANLQYVAERIGGKRFVFADNDASRTGEKAAEATGLPWVMSPFPGEDANDLHQRAGIWGLIKIMRAVK